MIVLQGGRGLAPGDDQDTHDFGICLQGGRHELLDRKSLVDLGWKKLLLIKIEGEQEYYLLRLSDKSDLEIRIPFMNNHRLRFDRNVGRVVEVTGQYKVVDGKKTLVSLKATKAP